MPDDVWLVDLDSNKVKQPKNAEELPPLPEYEGNILVQNLQKILHSMAGLDQTKQSSTIYPLAGSSNISTTPDLHSHHVQTPTFRSSLNPQMTNSVPASPSRGKRPSLTSPGQLMHFAASRLGGISNSSDSGTIRGSRNSIVSAAPAFDPSSFVGTDSDAADVATRITMVRFFNSPSLLANFSEHTRTIRLYPRPVVSFQKSSFIQSRIKPSPFLMRLVETQAVEYMAEWVLCPDNVAFLRIQTGVLDPAIVGDKPKWYEHQLEPLRYKIWETNNKNYYDEVAQLINDAGNTSGRTTTTSRFNDFFDDEQNDCQGDREALDELIVDANNNTIIESHSHIEKEEDSLSDSSSELEDNLESRWPNLGTDGTNCCRSVDSRKSSVSSSSSSNYSMSADGNMRSIPANYQHDIGRFPPLRCDVNKNFCPPTTLVLDIQAVNPSADANIASTIKTDKESAEQLQPKRRLSQQVDRIPVSPYSSDDEDGTSSRIPNSSSDDSGPDDFDFGALDTDISPHKSAVVSKPENGAEGVILRCAATDKRTRDSVSSQNDTDSLKKQISQADENDTVSGNNQIASRISVDGESITSEIVTIAENLPSSAQLTQGFSDQQNLQQSIQRTKTAPLAGTTFISDLRETINDSIRNPQSAQKISSAQERAKATMTNIINKASSLSDSHFKRSGSVTKDQLQSQGQTPPSPPPPSSVSSFSKTPSPTTFNGGPGTGSGSLIDRFTSEARDAVREAKAAAIDAGKNAIRVTKPAADVGRQKLLRNLQALSDPMKDTAREILRSREDSIESALVNPETEPTPSASVERLPSNASSGMSSDLNGLADKANNMFNEWFGSKASGFAKQVKDRTKPFGPFPTSKIHQYVNHMIFLICDYVLLYFVFCCHF